MFCDDKGATQKCTSPQCKLYAHPHCALKSKIWQFNITYSPQKKYGVGMCCAGHFRKKRGGEDGWFDSGMFRDYCEYGLEGFVDLSVGEVRAISTGVSDQVIFLLWAFYESVFVMGISLLKKRRV